jgi:uracil phosphoribosyltransferase
MQMTQGYVLQFPVTVVPILRAGLGLAEGVMHLLPKAAMGHVGMFRDEKALTPVSYYEKLPKQISQGPVLLVDPMLATGGSAVAAVDLLKERGCTDIRFLCLIAAPEGVEKLSEAHPDVPIYTAALDEKLNENGYIMPGLGDAGDRLYGTL